MTNNCLIQRACAWATVTTRVKTASVATGVSTVLQSTAPRTKAITSALGNIASSFRFRTDKSSSKDVLVSTVTMQHRIRRQKLFTI